MRKREAIKKHREMWRKLSKTGTDKPHLYGILNSCYLCAYGYSLYKGVLNSKIYVDKICFHCPLEWPSMGVIEGQKIKCPCEDGLYGIWKIAEGNVKKALAKGISMLKEKKMPKQYFKVSQKESH